MNIIRVILSNVVLDKGYFLCRSKAERVAMARVGITDSFRSASWSFCQRTNLHALSQITHTPHVAVRVFWALVFAGGLAALSYHITYVTQIYFEYPYQVKLKQL